MTVLSIGVPGDKSIAHRALVFACLANGESSIRGLPGSADVGRTRDALSALGARFETQGDETRVRGRVEFQSPERPVECGNSGTTARFLVGILAGLGIRAVLDGDESLRGRPMDRIVYPLQAMGARIRYLETPDRLPVEVQARATGSLRPLRHRPRVASAQVKSSLLLAGLLSGTRVEIREPVRSRDHTERLLSLMGAPVVFGPEADGWRAIVEPEGWQGRLTPLHLVVPGDPSSAAFLVVAAIFGRRRVEVRDVCLNPSRMGYLEVLRRAGASISVRQRAASGPEPVGDITVAPSVLRGFRLEGAELVDAIDEIPILAIAAARAHGITEIRDAAELRVKESDRLTLLASNLRRLGVAVEEFPDGMRITGTDRPLTGPVETRGDHRIAMAFSVLASDPISGVRIDDPQCADISYPGFAEALRRVTGPGEAA